MTWTPGQRELPSLDDLSRDLAALDRMSEYLSAEEWLAAFESIHAAIGRVLQAWRDSLEMDE